MAAPSGLLPLAGRVLWQHHAGAAALARQAVPIVSGLASTALQEQQQQQPTAGLTECSRIMDASTSHRTFFSQSAQHAPAKKFDQRRLMGWSGQQMYDIVANVKDYHHFVPWCQKSRITKPLHNNYFEAELEVGFQVLVERYTSQVFLTPQRQVRTKVANSTLFHHLDSTWTMEQGPTPASCWLTFHVDFAFRSQLHGYLADLFFSEVVKQMSCAFERRAARLHGPSSLIRGSTLKPAPASGGSGRSA